jgi:very-short-patch-repair endonuclease
MGLTVIRIENRYVTENLEGVLAHLSQNFRGS